MRQLILLIGCATCLAAPAIEAASLNKCTDAQGKVTYSNLPCRNARESSTVEIDPTPKPDLVKPRAAKPPPVPTPPPAVEPTTTRLDTRSTTARPKPPLSARQCDSLSDKLGSVFDKMDQARRNGYTQDQMNKWNQEIKNLEAKKQQSGCF